MIRRNENSTLPWDVFYADRSIPKEEPCESSKDDPEKGIDDPAHNFVAITAIMRSSTSCSSNSEVSTT